MENYMTNLTTAAFNLTTTENHMTTVAPSGGLSEQVVGYIGVVVAVLLFGSNLVPVKKFETGDGIPICLCTHILPIYIYIYMYIHIHEHM